MKPQQKAMIVLGIAAVVFGGFYAYGAFVDHQTAADAEKMAEVERHKGLAEAAEKRSQELEAEANELRDQRKTVTLDINENSRKIKAHKRKRSNESLSSIELRDSFILMGYGHPR